MQQDLSSQVPVLEKKTSGLNVVKVLQLLSGTFKGQVTFSTSFGNEDQVITDHIAQSRAGISIFTLDTGRLFETTYDVWNRSLDFFGLPIRAFYPPPETLSAFTSKNGPNSFYRSAEWRSECCYIRKTLPLQSALADNAVWITGLRAEHSAFRARKSKFEWDEQNGIIKYHPLLDWTTEQVTAYIKRYDLPYNPLTDKGFVSIGCAPCTRAVKEGEDFRAGRWWWEDSTKKECGLHWNTSVSNNNETKPNQSDNEIS